MKRSIIALIFICSFTLAHSQTSTLNRINDPIILKGNQLTNLSALQPAQIVGFKFMGSWIQIPIQIDEMNLLDIVSPYGPLAVGSNIPPSPNNPKIRFYCDPATYIGVDTDPLFDSDDELVAMVTDAGGLSNGTTPTGTIPASCTQVTINDPLGGTGYIYLFQQDGSLQQDAGQDYVNMTTDVFSVAGFPAHNSGWNNENTTITSSKYSWHFSAEWVSDEYKLTGGTNVDILDRHKSFFAPGFCQRSENTFSQAENAYITIKDGPLRVIRSYMGANSGPLTQRTHLFYEGRQDILTDLRVHTISAIFDAFDFNSNANGMIYTDQNTPAGVTVDGQPDQVGTATVEWIQLQGQQGTVSVLYRTITDILEPQEASFGNYYDDNSSNPNSNCTGDGQHWGASGGSILFVSSQNVCTDPFSGGCATTYNSLQGQRIIYSDDASASTTSAATYNSQYNNPLTVSVGACQTTACLDIDVSLWLEGVLTSTNSSMTTTLYSKALLPDLQPYGQAPWNYAGLEGDGWTIADYPSGTVDWVLVSFRTAIAASSTVFRKAGVLLSDGTITFPGDCISTSDLPGTGYYVLVEHRNHMGALSPMPVLIQNNQLLYDFRGQDSYSASGTATGQIQPATGIWALIAGDVDPSDFPSYDVNSGDKALWLIENGTFNSYEGADINQDGDITGADRLIWHYNSGLFSAVPR